MYLNFLNIFPKLPIKFIQSFILIFLKSSIFWVLLIFYLDTEFANFSSSVLFVNADPFLFLYLQTDFFAIFFIANTFESMNFR